MAKKPKIMVVCKPSRQPERSSMAQDEHEATVSDVETALGRLPVECDAPYTGGVAANLSKSNFDLVITVGGDGTLLYVSHCISDIPVLGVNSAPSSSVGFFCGAGGKNIGDVVEAWLDKAIEPTPVTRMQVTVDGRVLTKRGLNDALFCHANPALTTRYTLHTEDGDEGEAQMSSGMWFSTAVGSTAAIRSAGGFTMPHDSPNIQWLVREAYQPTGRRLQYVHGFQKPGETVEIVSGVEDGRVYVDGSHLTSKVKLGGVLDVRGSTEPLHILAFREG